MSYIVLKPDILLHNISVMQDVCRKQGIRLVIVTKAVCSHPAVPELCAAARVSSIADAHIESSVFLTERRIPAELLQMRLSDIPSVCDEAKNISRVYISDEALLCALRGAEHVPDIMLAIEAGDGRDGIAPERLAAVIRENAGLPLRGVSAQWGCMTKRLPDARSFRLLEQAADIFEQSTGRKAAVAAGGTVLAPHILCGALPSGITEVRIGEAVLTGFDSVCGQPVFGMRQDAWQLYAHIVEAKPAAPRGGKPRLRCVLDIGSLAAPLKGLIRDNPDIVFHGQTFDYTAAELSETRKTEANTVRLNVGYETLAGCFIHPYVDKKLPEVE